MKSIAIDLGTDFCKVAHITKSGIVEVIPNKDGDLKTPSIVSWASAKPAVGKGALPDLILNPKHVARRTKRYMGKNTESGKPIPVTPGPDGDDKTAVDTASAILAYLKDSAETYLGEKVDAAVITVPANSDAAARDNTKAAAKIAGFTRVVLEDEPVAAGTYYELEKGRDENAVVADFGGGTTDVTFIEKEGKKVKATLTENDAELGGGNYEEEMLEWECNEAKPQGIEISAEKDLPNFCMNLDRTREAKEMLSRREEVTLVAEANGKRLPIKFTRQMLREVGRSLDERFVNCCKRLLEKIHSQGKKIDRVLLVGGSTRLPHVPEMAKEVFGMEPSRDTDPDFAVVKGAALLAARHFGDKDQVLKVGEHRYLAAEICVQKVAAHAICVAARKKKPEDDGKEYNVEIVPAGIPLPYDFEERFAPVRPGQSSIIVKIVQGEPEALSDNCPIIRKFTVPIQPCTEDMERILLKGRYTEEALIEMTVVDDLLNKPINVSFTYKAGLSEAEIDEKRDQLRRDME
jgi:molecular chaperone DnaK